MVDNFIEIRKKIFTSQSNMAEALNITRQAISSIEQGKSKPSIELLYKLLNQFNININYLLANKGNMLLSDTEKASTAQHIQELNDRIKELEFENKLLKELIKK